MKRSRKGSEKSAGGLGKAVPHRPSSAASLVSRQATAGTRRRTPKGRTEGLQRTQRHQSFTERSRNRKQKAVFLGAAPPAAAARFAALCFLAACAGLSAACSNTARKGISLCQSGSGSARKGGAFLAKHLLPRHRPHALEQLPRACSTASSQLTAHSSQRFRCAVRWFCSSTKQGQ